MWRRSEKPKTVPITFDERYFWMEHTQVSDALSGRVGLIASPSAKAPGLFC
jgi:hypothetical protein